MGKRSIWDILQWISLFIFLLYLFLKWSGFLHSPIAVDLTAVLSLGYFLGLHVQKLNHLVEEVKDIKIELKDVRLNLKEHVEDRSLHR